LTKTELSKYIGKIILKQHPSALYFWIYTIFETLRFHSNICKVWWDM